MDEISITLHIETLPKSKRPIPGEHMMARNIAQEIKDEHGIGYTIVPLRGDDHTARLVAEGPEKKEGEFEGGFEIKMKAREHVRLLVANHIQESS